MSFMDSIISWLKSIEDYFYDAYLEVYDWVYPGWLLSYPLLSASRGFGWLAYYFSQLNEWLVWAQDEIERIISYEAIQSYFQSWFDAGLDAWNWVRDSYGNVWDIADDWWSSKSATVQSWIATATEGLQTLQTSWGNFWDITFPQWKSQVERVTSEWEDFVTQKLPSLISSYDLTTWWDSRLGDIQDLIDSAFAIRDDFWQGWQDWRDEIAEFFTDPLEFLLARFTNWFLGEEK